MCLTPLLDKRFVIVPFKLDMYMCCGIRLPVFVICKGNPVAIS